MKLTKRQHRIVQAAIHNWQEDAVISSEISDRLRGSLEVSRFDWKRFAKYSFWIALVAAIIAFGAMIQDEVLEKLLALLPEIPDYIISIALMGASLGVYAFALRRKRHHPQKTFSNEAIMFAGVLLTAASIGFLGKSLDNGSDHYSLLLLLSTIIYGIMGLVFPSRLIWVFALLSFGSWFGTETGYVSGWGAYFLGMNFPLRFVLFGAILIGIGFAFRQVPRFKMFAKSTHVLGLLYFFIALWILSIFGNYGDMDDWWDTKQVYLLHWGILFGVMAVLSILYGLKTDNGTFRGFGIVFLGINLYTKFFEFFWDSTHKAIFFAILSLSFFLIGRRAEKIWYLGRNGREIEEE